MLKYSIHILITSRKCVRYANYKLALAIDICHRHLPSTSTRIKSYAAVAADFQHALKGVQSGEQK